ncbi:MAG: hypothetical protein AAF293_01440 [Pseudomonadota bacterium]
MAQNPNTPKQSSGAPTWAYFFVAASGGVVGHDYATALQVDPVVGAGLGMAISAIITRILYWIADDPGNHIQEWCTGIGALVLGVAGFSSAMEQNLETGPSLVMTAICAAVGAGIGRIFAALVGLSALLLLFFSQGPVGAMVRTAILNQ